MRTRVFFAFGLVCAFVVALTPTLAHAQASTGRLFVDVIDAARAPIAGATVQITVDVPRTTATNDRGRATFLRVVPGRYRLTVSKTGLATRTLDAVTIDASGDLRLTVVLDAAPGASGAQPGMAIADDSRRVTTSLAREDLDRLPTTGDPFGVLQTVPAVVLDRVNVGGTESVQQPAMSANGAGVRDNTWSVDGVPITDLVSMGLSSAYVGLNLFDQVGTTTGGFDPALATAGVNVSLLLRSGTDIARGSASVAAGSHALTGKNLTSAASTQIESYRRLNRDVDGGVEFGGPLSRKTLFGWGGYNVQTPNLDVVTRATTPGPFVTATRDASTVHDGAFKLAWVRSADTRLTVTYFGSHRSRDGADAGPSRPVETSLTQHTTSQFGSVRLDRAISAAFLLTARYALVPSTTSSDSAGAPDAVAYRDDAGVWHNAYQFDTAHQRQHVLAADADYRWHGQDLRFGAGLRSAAVDERSGWPGGQFDEFVGYPILLAEAVRDRRTLGHTRYLDAFAGDTLHWGSLTFDAGVRWDRQAGSVDATSIDANPVSSSRLPALQIAGQSNALVWSLASPRLGVAWAPGRTHGTLIRGSYARFASPMDAGLAASLAGAPLASIAFSTVLDKNGDHVLSAGDTSSPAGTSISNTRIGTTTAPRTDAFVGEFSRATAGLSLHAAVTVRRVTNTNWLHLDGITGANFTQVTTITGTLSPVGSFEVPLSRVNGAQVAADLLETYEARPGYSQQFVGFEASASKGAAAGSSWRIGMSSGRTEERFDAIAAHYDPTPAPPGLDAFSLSSPNVSGGDVARLSIDSNGQGVFVLTPRYQVFATATVTLPWRLRATPAYFVRQGFAAPYFASDAPGSADASSPDGKSVLLPIAIGTFRLPIVHELDVRITRPLTFAGRTWSIDVDVFNVLNRATPLARQLDARAPGFDGIAEVQSPLTVRIGVRVPIR